MSTGLQPSDALFLLGPAALGPSAWMTGRRQENAQKEINQMNIDESRRMLQQQREWALSDWDKVNAYNSPDQQMQRYKDAGLNPQLIYGSAQNSPSAMIRTPNGAPAKAEAGGILQGIANQGNAVSGTITQMMNQAMAVQSMRNDTNLKEAQILNLKSQSDKTQQQMALTTENFKELAIKAAVDNDLKRSQSEILGMQGRRMPTEEQSSLINQANVVKADAQALHSMELFKLAKQEGKLKQADIDMMEKLAGLKGGPQMINDLLKIILASAAKSTFR